MADTTIGPASPQAVKRWSVDLMRETFGQMTLRGLMGRSNTAFIKILMDLDRDAGDNIKYDLREQSRADGVSGDALLEGNESQMIFFQDEININLKRDAHVFTTMSQQRTVHDLRREARDNKSNWFAWGIEAGLLAHLAGNTGDSNESAQGFLREAAAVPGSQTSFTDVFGNDVDPVDANHTVAIDSNFSPAFIEDAVAVAKTANPMVPFGRVDGRDCYVLLIHPYANRSLRQSTDVSENVGWLDSMRNAGVRGEANPIWTGATYFYNNVMVVESEFVPFDPVNNHCYNVMLGGCAGTIAFGNAWNRMSSVRSATGGSAFSFVEDIDDYGNRTGYGVGSMVGFKRANFNSEAYGTVLVRSTDLPPS